MLIMKRFFDRFAIRCTRSWALFLLRLIVPLVNHTLDLQIGREPVDVVVGCPEELSEVLGALQLMRDVLHVLVQTLNKVNSLLRLLFEIRLKSLHVHWIRPSIRIIATGAHWVARTFPRLFFNAYPLDVLHLIVQAHIHFFIKLCKSLFRLVPDHRERILVVAEQIDSLTTPVSVDVGLSSG